MSGVRTFHHVSSIQTYFWQSILTGQRNMPNLCQEAFVCTRDVRDMEEDARRQSFYEYIHPRSFRSSTTFLSCVFNMTCIPFPSHEF